MTQPTAKHRETARAFQWLIDEVPQWWKDATGENSGATIDVSTGSVYIAGVKLASRGDYILCVAGKLWSVPAKVFKAIEADAFTAGRADRQAEDAKIARRFITEHIRPILGATSQVAEAIESAILAPSSGPSHEQRIRAEIAEAVATVPGYITIGDIGRAKTLAEYRDDVLAAIRNGGEQ